MTRWRLLRSERGATITEAAFILPVFILFLMIVMEGGRVLGAWMVLTNSTRETARYLIVGQQQTNAQNACTTGNSTDWTCVQNSLKATGQTFEQALVANMLSPQPLVVTPSFTTDAIGRLSAVTVKATYTVHTLTPMVQKI